MCSKLNNPMPFLAVLVFLPAAWAEVPKELESVFRSRTSQYLYVSITWSSSNVLAPRSSEFDEDNPFKNRPDSGPLPGVEFESDDNFLYLRGADGKFQRSGVVTHNGARKPSLRAYSYVSGETRIVDLGNASGIVRKGLSSFEVPDSDFRALMLNYRPKSTEFYRLLKRGEFELTPGVSIWARRRAVMFRRKANSATKTEYFFDAEKTGVFLGYRMRSPWVTQQTEILTSHKNGKLVINKYDEKSFSPSGELRSQRICSNFKYEFVPFLDDLQVKFQSGMHVRLQNRIGEKFKKFICRDNGKLEPLTDENYLDLDPRARPNTKTP